MDASAKAKLNKALLLVTGVTALAVGLGALNINLMGILHIEQFDQILRYLVGFAGLTTLAIFIKESLKD